MFIKKLILNNFKTYRGFNSFEFPMVTNKNIILIIGKNGSGKTSILEGIKLALYGPLLYGYKTVNNSYLKKIEKKINYRALKNKEKCIILLELTLKENSDFVNYTIERRWITDGKNIKEELEISRENKKLTEVEISIFNNTIRYFLPPALIDLFFFDGEKLSNLVEGDNLQLKLKESFDKIFNIQLFSLLKEDLTQYIIQNNNNKSISPEEKELVTLNKKLTLIIHQINKYEEEIKFFTQEVIVLESQIKEDRNQLRSFGSLEKDEIKELQKKYKKLEEEKNLIHIKNKIILETIFPFHIVRSLLKELQQVIQLELELEKFRSVKKLLFEDKLLEIIIKDSLNHLKVLNKMSEENFKLFLQTIYKNITKKLEENEIEKSFNYKLHRFMSEEDILLVNKLVNDTGDKLRNQIEKNFKMISKINEKLLSIKKNIELNYQNSDFEKLLNRIEKNTIEVAKFKEKIKRLEEEIDSRNKEKIVIEKQIDKLEEKIDYYYRGKNVHNITYKIIKLCNEFIEDVREKKKEILAKETLHTFNTIIGKQDLIKEIKIKNDFSFELLNGSSDLINFNQLSAGEKQVFIISILGSLVKLSNRDFPVIFDSFLGRLDKTHKSEIVSKYVPNAHAQVYLLVNDNEIDQSDLKVLEKKIAKRYDLIYDNQTKSTILR